MSGQIIVLQRQTFVDFYSKYFKIDAARANYFFSTWAIFLTHAEVRAASNDSLKDALAVHIADVVNNSKLLLSKPLGKAQSYKEFVQMITPELYEFMKRDFSYIDDAIKDHEADRIKRPGRLSPIESVSIDISLNADKPTYERGGELLNAAGMALDRRVFLAGNFLSSVGSDIAGWWNDTVNKTEIEIGVKQRDRSVIIPKIEIDDTNPTSAVAPKPASPNQLNNSDYTDPVFKELVQSGTISENKFVRASSETKRGTASGGNLDVKLESPSVGGAKSANDAVRLTDAEYPVLQFIQNRMNKQ